MANKYVSDIFCILKILFNFKKHIKKTKITNRRTKNKTRSDTGSKKRGRISELKFHNSHCESTGVFYH